MYAYIVLLCTQKQNYVTKTNRVKSISPSDANSQVYFFFAVLVVVFNKSRKCLLCNTSLFFFGKSLQFLQISRKIFRGVQVKALTGQSITFTLVFRRGFFTRSDVCFGLLSCWKTKERLRPSVAVECLRFCSKSR